MDIPFSRWYSAILIRRSRRSFDRNRLIERSSLAPLEKVCREFTPFPHARASLVNQPAKDIFKGIAGSYGKVSGAPAFVAFIGDLRAPSVQEEVGYTGEGVVLEATALGLNTCWVGGFFNRESVDSLVELGHHEKVLAVTPVGYARESESLKEKLMTGFGRTHERLPAEKLLGSQEDREWPEWINTSIEAARLAPSATNRQPWSFNISTEGVTVFVRGEGPEFGVSKRLDCGIAMLHLEVAAATCGIKGEWQLLPPPEVAKFLLKG
ncbi:MAG: nitroreductase family protein [Dehalococcoidales bacterium]|nr:nitroreductase family protein [Dehalococcoidales bacterium]